MKKVFIKVVDNPFKNWVRFQAIEDILLPIDQFGWNAKIPEGTILSIGNTGYYYSIDCQPEEIGLKYPPLLTLKELLLFPNLFKKLP